MKNSMLYNVGLFTQYVLTPTGKVPNNHLGGTKLLKINERILRYLHVLLCSSK